MSEEPVDVRQTSLIQRVWRSIRREPLWPSDDRGRMRLAMNDLILHLHPTRIPERSLKLTYTFGLGGLSVLLLVILIGTGVLLMFTYTPSPEGAYQSIQEMETAVWFGQLVRNVHHWSGNLLVIVAFLHMLRVFYTGAFRKPREFNWILGLLMLFLVVIASFTGYLLPWDQLSYWAVTVMAGLVDYIPIFGETIRSLVLGGDEVGRVTLRNFFALHVILIPLGFFFIGSFHIWRVRKDKATVPRNVEEADPEKKQRIRMVTTIPHLVSIELVYALVVLALLLGWASLIDAPLLAPANVNAPPDPAKAAWYFAGLQELLLHFHPFIGSVLIPVMVVGLLVYLPYTRADEGLDYAGIWFRSTLGRRLALISTLLGAFATLVLILLDEVGNLADLMPGVDTIISNGYLPLGVIVIAIWGYAQLLRKRGATRSEMRLALFSLLLGSFLMLTLIGNAFRGPAWHLMWPWEVYGA